MAKKILGLDVGNTSIGWALIEEKDKESNRYEIIDMGCRIIPVDKDEKELLIQGKGETKNQLRRRFRTLRRNNFRFKLRREQLLDVLKKNNMWDENLRHLAREQLWELRAKAVTEKISFTELGRVLYHLNQRRGFKSGSKHELTDKDATKTQKDLLTKFEQLKHEGKTVGQKFYELIKADPYYRVKEQTYPREAYMQEYDAIMACQQQFYPDVLTPEFIEHIRNHIIFYQRPLKSQKHLVSICEFEGKWIKTKNEKLVFAGPPVAPKSSPLFQEDKIWGTLNNIEINSKKLSLEEKKLVYSKLLEKEILTGSDLKNIFKTDKYVNYTKIQGNTTYHKLRKVLASTPFMHLLQFDVDAHIQTIERIDPNTGEVKQQKMVAETIFQEPLYQLWHTIYSIQNVDECKQALTKKFHLPEELAQKLAEIDFVKEGFGSKSAKAIRKLLPYLREGKSYDQAAIEAGYTSHTHPQHLLEIKDKLEILPKNSLRQPVVEKVLNQLIHLVNHIIDPSRGLVTPEERKTGKFEIRIELARELKASKEKRNKIYQAIKRNENINKKIDKKLEELGLTPTKTLRIKWKLFHLFEPDDDTLHFNGRCLYCGETFSLTEALTGQNVNIEHIIPKTLYFDDSLHNKILAHEICNRKKGDRTALDYMASKGKDALNAYLQRVEELEKLSEKSIVISKRKLKYLTMKAEDIPQDFLNRDLRETAYITKKAKEILQPITASEIRVTSGMVTAKLRYLWGWNNILNNVPSSNNFEEENQELEEDEEDAMVASASKSRNDHRHHAIDALVIACTKQGYIQRINTLPRKETRESLRQSIDNKAKNEANKAKKEDYKNRLTLLENYLINQKPFETEVVKRHVEKILVSSKAGKKVATWNKNIYPSGKIQKVLTPRGELHEQTYYGKIKVIVEKKIPDIFTEYEKDPSVLDNIISPRIRTLVENYLAQNNYDPKKAKKNLNQQPIYLDADGKYKLEKVRCYETRYVYKFPAADLLKKITPNKEDTLSPIVDKKIQEIFKNASKNKLAQLFYHPEKQIPIRSVRITTQNVLVPLYPDKETTPYVKTGNNHHVAIYLDNKGKLQEHVCTFWHAVQRKLHGFPVVVETPSMIPQWIEQAQKSLATKNKQLPDQFIKELPDPQWQYIFSMQKDEYFILGLHPEEAIKAINQKDYKTISDHLYCVMKLSKGDYFFRKHNLSASKLVITKSIEGIALRIKSLEKFKNLYPIKVRLNMLGNIVDHQIIQFSLD